jgi:hypothetical protein
MKLLYFGLLVCVLASLVNAIYVPPFRIQDADSPFVNTIDGSTDLIKESCDDDKILEQVVPPMLRLFSLFILLTFLFFIFYFLIFCNRIDYIKLNPATPVRGENLHIDFKGKLKETVYDGAYVRLTVKYRYVQLIKKVFDLCDEIQKIDEKCPLEKGDLLISKDVQLPKAIRKYQNVKL